MYVQEKEVYRKLLLLLVSSKRCITRVCSELEVTPVQGLLLIIMDADTPKTMNELSEQMGCDASNITGLIEKLENSALIERISDPNDRRVKIICLTNKGIKCRDKLLDNVQKSSQFNLGRLNAKDLEAFNGILDRISG